MSLHRGKLFNYFKSLSLFPDVFFLVQTVKVSDLGRPKEMSEQVYQTMAGMTILVTHLVVEFAKKVPGFQDLERDDQITLLKVSSISIVIKCNNI